MSDPYRTPGQVESTGSAPQQNRLPRVTIQEFSWRLVRVSSREFRLERFEAVELRDAMGVRTVNLAWVSKGSVSRGKEKDMALLAGIDKMVGLEGFFEFFDSLDRERNGPVPNEAP